MSRLGTWLGIDLVDIATSLAAALLVLAPAWGAPR